MTTKCHGFNKLILPHILKAFENKEVKWTYQSGFAQSFSGKFIWLDCEWKIDEMNEYITDIWLLKGTLDSVDLTAAVLRG